MSQQKTNEIEVKCVLCGKQTCQNAMQGQTLENNPPNCPAKTMPEILETGLSKTLTPESKEFARQAALQQCDGMGKANGTQGPLQCRVEETIEFAKKMGYRKLGLAFCSGLRKEAVVFHRVLEQYGFQIF